MSSHEQIYDAIKTRALIPDDCKLDILAEVIRTKVIEDDDIIYLIPIILKFYDMSDTTHELTEHMHNKIENISKLNELTPENQYIFMFVYILHILDNEHGTIRPDFLNLCTDNCSCPTTKTPRCNNTNRDDHCLMHVCFVSHCLKIITNQHNAKDITAINTFLTNHSCFDPPTVRLSAKLLHHLKPDIICELAESGGCNRPKPGYHQNVWLTYNNTMTDYLHHLTEYAKFNKNAYDILNKNMPSITEFYFGSVKITNAKKTNCSQQ